MNSVSRVINAFRDVTKGDRDFDGMADKADTDYSDLLSLMQEINEIVDFCIVRNRTIYGELNLGEKQAIMKLSEFIETV